MWLGNACLTIAKLTPSSIPSWAELALSSLLNSPLIQQPIHRIKCKKSFLQAQASMQMKDDQIFFYMEEDLICDPAG